MKNMRCFKKDISLDNDHGRLFLTFTLEIYFMFII